MRRQPWTFLSYSFPFHFHSLPATPTIPKCLVSFFLLGLIHILILSYLASTVASQGGCHFFFFFFFTHISPFSYLSLGAKKTRSAAAAATNSGPKTRQATAQAVGSKAPGAKAPSKKEVDLKAFALRQKKEAQKKAQQAKDEGMFSF